MYGPSFGFFDAFGIFGVIWVIVALFIVSLIVVVIVKSVGQWNKDNHSPRLTVPATIVAKRMKVSGGSGDHMSSTSYYVTFQVESGDRMELHLSGTEYGMLAEGDRGSLTFQGSRFVEFKR